MPSAPRDPIDSLVARLRARRDSALRPGESLCVAFSGGRDSSVLLDALCRLGGALRARHVHHGLSPNAGRWAAHCKAFAAQRGVPLDIVPVQVEWPGRSGLEAQAREARYEALRDSGAQVVALAHHRDDQAETVLLQALRGTGLKGLAAMPVERQEGPCRWWRPLLDEPGEAIEAYARAAGLTWVEDESNAGLAAARNLLRQQIFPALASHFPQARESLVALAGHAATALQAAEAVAQEDLARLEVSGGLDADGLARLSPARQAEVIRACLARRGLPMPSRARLAAIQSQLLGARPDAQPSLDHAGWRWSRHGAVIHLKPREAADVRWSCPWRGDDWVELGARRGSVRFREAPQGIDPARVTEGVWCFGPRQGGERLRPREGGPSRTLKNLLREAGIPASDRGGLPLLFHDGRLVWAPGIGLSADHLARPGWLPEWIRPGVGA